MFGEVHNLDVDKRSTLALYGRRNGHHPTALTGSDHNILSKRLELDPVILLNRDSNMPRLTGFPIVDDP